MNTKWPQIPKSVPKVPQMAPKWSRNDPKRAQNEHEIVRTWPQNDPKNGPKVPKMTLKRVPKWYRKCPKRSRNGAKMTQKGSQNDPKSAQNAISFAELALHTLSLCSARPKPNGNKTCSSCQSEREKRMKKLLCLTARIQCASGKKTLQSNVKKTVTNVFDCRPAGYTFFQSVFYWSARLTTVELMPVVMLVCIHITHTTFIPPALYRRQLDQVTDFLTYLYHKFSELVCRHAGANTHWNCGNGVLVCTYPRLPPPDTAPTPALHISFSLFGYFSVADFVLAKTRLNKQHFHSKCSADDSTPKRDAPEDCR